MRTHPLRFAALAAALLAFGVSLAAQGPGPRPAHGFRGLNLTEAQQAQVKAIHERHQAALQAKQEAVRAARQAFHGALAQAAAEPKALRSLHEAAAAAQFDLLMEHRAVRAEILPLLTSEQKARFERRGPGTGPGRHPRGGRGPGSGPGFGPGPEPGIPGLEPPVS